MYDHLLRHPKKTLLLPLARILPLSPNLITALGLVIGLLCALLCALGLYSAALAMWVLNRILDGLDGEVARLRNSQTDLGGYLDILADLLIYAFVPIGLAVSSEQNLAWPATAFMLASFYLNVGSWMYLSSIFEKRGLEEKEFTTVAMPKGLIEGGETALFFTFFLIWPQHLSALFCLFGSLTFLGAFLRVRWAYSNV